ncbi:pre-mRNA-splicing factor spf27 [Anaeramoeba flamelloides]|uniref:Pre-mRNA-splicing factor spf27 n=1 Tax=Anaeramoeba flamelloides TaxID=1746091 RepID=A0AAV7Z7L7_9EUKA|nr:pre-mRNA-splicing factor spf27 [Anaeramoeba flamelloides]
MEIEPIDRTSLLDLLAYCDREYEEEGMEELVDKLIEEEKKKQPFEMGKYLEQIPDYQTTLKGTNGLLNKEFERISSGKPLNSFNASNYIVSKPKDKSLKDPKQWKKSIKRLELSTALQLQRNENLTLMSKFSSNSWLDYNRGLGAYSNNIRKRTQQIEEQTLDLNRARKFEQEQITNKLKRFKSRWYETVDRNLKTERACKNLEKEIEELEKKNLKK